MTDAVAQEIAATLRRLADLLDSATPVEPKGDLSVEQLAARLNRTVSTVRGWVAQGLFPGSYHLPSSEKCDKRGRKRLGAWRIPEAAIEAFRNRKPQRQVGDWRKVRRPAA